MADADSRLTEMEIALAHHERLTEELSEIVRAQADRLDALERKLALVVARIAEVESGDSAPLSPDVRPPHW